jgi:hypothetical protein
MDARGGMRDARCVVTALRAFAAQCANAIAVGVGEFRLSVTVAQ